MKGYRSKGVPGIIGYRSSGVALFRGLGGHETRHSGMVVMVDHPRQLRFGNGEGFSIFQVEGGWCWRASWHRRGDPSTVSGLTDGMVEGPLRHGGKGGPAQNAWCREGYGYEPHPLELNEGVQGGQPHGPAGYSRGRVFPDDLLAAGQAGGDGGVPDW